MANSTISIGFRIEEIDGGFKKLSMDADAFKKIMEGNTTEVEKMKKNFENFGKTSLAFDGIKNSVRELTAIMSDLQNAYKIQQEAEMKLETVMKQRMTATAEQIQSIKDLCSAQQDLGVIGDEVQLAGAQQLATFLKTDAALKILIPSMNNLVAQQKGLNATQGDAAAIANLFGKAMMGQTTALKRVGITFTEAESNAVKFGTEEQRAAALAKIITNNVGEMNAELAKTSSGRLKQFENTLGDVKEKMGAAISNLMPLMTGINQAVMLGTNIGKVNIAIKQGIVFVRQMGVQCWQTSTQMNFFGLSITATTTAMRVLVLTLKTLKLALISTGIGAIIWGIGEGISYVYSKLSGVKKEVEDITPAINSMASAQQRADDAMANATVQIQGHIKELKNFKGSKEDERAKIEELNNTYGTTMGTFSTINDWYKKLQASSEEWIAQIGREAEAEVWKEELIRIKRQQMQHDRNKPKPLPKTSGTSGFGQHQFQIPQNFTDNLNKAWQGQADYWKKKEDEVLDHIQSIKEQNYKAAKTLKSGIPSAPNKTTTAKTEEIIPKGSIADYEKQISELDKKIKLAIDPADIADMMSQIEQLKEKIGVIQIQAEISMKASEWGDLKSKVDQIELDPIKIGLEIDPKSLDLMKLPEKAPEDAKSLQKNIQGAAAAGRAAASAFSGMGDALDSKELDIAGIIMGAIANIMAGYASASSQASGMGPFGWAAFALSGLAEAMAVVSQIKQVTAFAAGGVVSGPTMALVGEYAGASNNPEVIAPLNKLRELLPEPGAGVQRIEVTGRLRGADIELAGSNYKSIRSASGIR